jgi:hypothetical protein
MSYSLWATNDGVTYKGRVAEPLPKGGWCVDVFEASDGNIPKDPLFLILDDAKTGDHITFKREGKEFVLEKQNG